MAALNCYQVGVGGRGGEGRGGDLLLWRPSGKWKRQMFASGMMQCESKSLHTDTLSVGRSVSLGAQPLLLIMVTSQYVFSIPQPVSVGTPSVTTVRSVSCHYSPSLSVAHIYWFGVDCVRILLYWDLCTLYTECRASDLDWSLGTN